MIVSNNFLPRFLRKQTQLLFENGSILRMANVTGPSTFSPRSTVDMKSANGSLTFTRGKRSRGGGELQQKQKMVNMLSLISPRRKQPQRIKMAYEDLLRHRTVHRAWQLVVRTKRVERRLELQKQYYKMKHACDELRKASQFLYESAMERPSSIRFPMEYRIPTLSPPRRIWDATWRSPVEEKQRRRTA
ncbi:mitochondrial ribosomal protein L28-domain-containing protein [Lipomyces orientalis]|uniref:Mitochondrial ribosomal protein L28-domain-containing protein n=1 Tax=Lipomyces orientalis TaxID=1233043 RepID=A0ACC3TE00_9ASCO